MNLKREKRRKKKNHFFTVAFLASLVLLLIYRKDNLMGNIGYILLNNANAPTLDINEAQTAASLFSRAQENVGNQRGLAQAYVTSREVDKAIKVWNSKDWAYEELLAYGGIARNESDWLSAKVWYERAIAVNPNIADGYYFVGFCKYNLGDPSALDFFEQALDKEESEYITIGRSDVLSQIARSTALSTDPPDWNSVLPEIENSLEVADFRDHLVSEGEVRVWRGQAMMAENRFIEAASIFMEVIDEWPNNYFAYIHLGNIKWQHNNDLVSAENLFSEAVNLFPNEPNAYFELVDMYLKTNQSTKAQSILEEVISQGLYIQEAEKILNLLKQ